MNNEPTVTVSKPAASPATSSSRLPASSSSRATVEGSAPPSEHIAAVPVTEERNPKKPILLLVAGLAVVGFMVVLIVGTFILVRKDGRKLSAKALVSATSFRLPRTSLSAKTPQAPSSVTEANEGTIVTSIAPGHDTTGHVSPSEALLNTSLTGHETNAVNTNSSVVSELSLATPLLTLSRMGIVNDTEQSLLSTETVTAATDAASESHLVAGDGESEKSHLTPNDTVTPSTASGDEGTPVTKFSESAAAALTGLMDVTVVRVDVSNKAESLSTEGVAEETSHEAATHAAQDVEVAELSSTPGATTEQ